jgi:hypothetical protein
MQQNNEPKRVTDDKIELIKSIAKLTLEELNRTEMMIASLQKKKSSLRRDVLDLKEGRLDRIDERHQADTESLESSVFTVQKKVTIGSKETSPWYFPYLIGIRQKDGSYNVNEKVDINNSVTRIHATGTYKLSSGDVQFI